MSEGKAASWPFPHILMLLPYKSVHALYNLFLNLILSLVNRDYCTPTRVCEGLLLQHMYGLRSHRHEREQGWRHSFTF